MFTAPESLALRPDQVTVANFNCNIVDAAVERGFVGFLGNVKHYPESPVSRPVHVAYLDFCGSFENADNRQAVTNVLRILDPAQSQCVLFATFCLRSGSSSTGHTRESVVKHMRTFFLQEREGLACIWNVDKLLIQRVPGSSHMLFVTAVYSIAPHVADVEGFLFATVANPIPVLLHVHYVNLVLVKGYFRSSSSSSSDDLFIDASLQAVDITANTLEILRSSGGNKKIVHIHWSDVLDAFRRSNNRIDQHLVRFLK